MIKFYFQYKRYILSAVILIALLSSFAFPAEGFARDFLLGLSAGIGIVIFVSGSNKTNNKDQKTE